MQLCTLQLGCSQPSTCEFSHVNVLSGLPNSNTSFLHVYVTSIMCMYMYIECVTFVLTCKCLHTTHIHVHVHWWNNVHMSFLPFILDGPKPKPTTGEAICYEILYIISCTYLPHAALYLVNMSLMTLSFAFFTRVTCLYLLRMMHLYLLLYKRLRLGCTCSFGLHVYFYTCTCTCMYTRLYIENEYNWNPHDLWPLRLWPGL